MRSKFYLACLAAIILPLAAVTQTIGASEEPAQSSQDTTEAAEAPAGTQWGCGAITPDECHFTVFLTDPDDPEAEEQVREFTLASGEKDTLTDVRVGEDTYCVAVNEAPDPETCERITVNAEYNF